MAAAHWSDAYVDVPYVKGVSDCGGLCERIQREVFGRPLSLPTERGESWQDYSRIIAEHKDAYLAPTDAPVEGDCVLMTGRAADNHLGTLLVIAGERYVLHAMEGPQISARHRVRDLPRFNITVEGYYRWR